MDVQQNGWFLVFSLVIVMGACFFYAVINSAKRRKKLITDLSHLDDVELINDYKILQVRMRNIVNTLDKTPGRLSEGELSDIFVRALLERQFRGDPEGNKGTGSETDG